MKEGRSSAQGRAYKTYPRINLYKYKLESDIVKSIPFSVAQRHQVVPIEKRGGRLSWPWPIH